MTFYIREHERVDVQMILSEPKFFRCIDNQIFLPMVLRCLVTQCFTRHETCFFCNITKAFTRHRMNFPLTEKFERTLRSLETSIFSLCSQGTLNGQASKLSYGQGVSVWREGSSLPSPFTSFYQFSRSIHFGDISEANGRTTWPEMLWPRGIMGEVSQLILLLIVVARHW